ncbi:FtsX-like permease family protein [Mucilaginibacter corticis]|uniref:FtsX-like permease family protein n=1 Tax=Mucilaginibacter corticis TaxID=2597670 RepID=A0A556MXI2_9SPHI|nr:ABC transporter permease [Mucilaginibacter corticis]TSJ44595.1 FtsX-like permease family protein [Mucilaginibacter corticis]
MIRNYIKTAFRSLLKNKGFTTINVLGLAFGLAACLLIVFYVIDELSYDKFNTNANRIYRVNTDIKYGGNASSYAITPPPLAAALKNFPEVAGTIRLLHDGGLRIKKGNENIQEEKVVYSDANVFDVFTLPLIIGDAKTALKDPYCVVVTESTAKKYFNTTHVVGKVLTINNTTPFKITGVMADIPAQSHFNFDFFLSLSSRDEAKSTNWLNYVCSTYILLKPGASAKSVEAKFPALMHNAINTLPNEADMNMDRLEKSGNYFRLNLTPMTEIHLSSNRRYELGVNSSMQYVYIFSAIAIFILLLACINFINLSTARSASRAREVGVRKVLGSPRKYLITQFICESVLITVFATVIAGVIAWLLLPVFNNISGKSLTINLHTLAWWLPFLLITAIMVGVFAGIYPAFFLSSFKPVNVLKGKIATGFKGGNMRGFLITMQFTVSIFLVIGTLVIYNQLNYIQNRDIGFNRNQVLTIKNTGVLNKQARTLKQEIKQLPGVSNATLTSFLPTGKNRNPDAVFVNNVTDPKNALFTEIWTIDDDYLNTTGMKVLKGRNFNKDLPTDSTGILINEAAAKMLGFYNDPLKRKLYSPQPGRVKEYTVLGVVKDFNFNSLRDNITPVVMILGNDNRDLSVRVNTKDLTATLALIRQKWNTLSPGEHFDYSFMDEDFDAAYRAEQRTGTSFLIFTMLAIVIACLGLFGLTAYAAEQRSKEIGIRKILGAEVSAIVAMLSKDLIKLVVIAIVIAIPLAWLVMQKWLQGFAYRQNIQVWVLLLAGTGSLFIAFITISIQCFKAALVNPVKSLKDQ